MRQPAAREFDLLAFTRVMKTGSSSLLASLRESPRYAAARRPLVLEASAREGREFDFASGVAWPEFTRGRAGAEAAEAAAEAAGGATSGSWATGSTSRARTSRACSRRCPRRRPARARGASCT